MKPLSTHFLIALLVPLVLMPASPAGAQVQIIEQFAELELTAHAFCPDEQEAPDEELHVFHDLVTAPSAFSNTMNGVCSSARASAELGFDVEAQAIEGLFSVSTEFLGYGDAETDFRGHIKFRVAAPTQVTIHALSEYPSMDPKTRLGESGLNGDELSKVDPGLTFILSGPNVTVMIQGGDYEENWTRTLVPGGDYTITMEANSHDWCCIHQFGTPWPPPAPFEHIVRRAMFRMEFDTVVVGAVEQSWGTLKARY